MDNLFSQYPAGTTGSFTVNADRSVSINLNIPATDTPSDVKKRSWEFYRFSVGMYHLETFMAVLRQCGVRRGYYTCGSLYFAGKLSNNIIERLGLEVVNRDMFMNARRTASMQPTGTGKPATIFRD